MSTICSPRLFVLSYALPVQGKSKPDALYDNGVSGGGNGSEGLYDEPANNPAGLRSVAKQNPVYASSEHLYKDEDEHNATGCECQLHA